MPYCAGTKTNGDPCNFHVTNEGDFCRHHAGQRITQVVENPTVVVESPRAVYMRKSEHLSTEESDGLMQEENVSRDAERKKAAFERRMKARDYKKRVGAHEGQRMVVAQRPGYVRRWVNDVGSRIDTFLDKGYDFVYDDGNFDQSDDVGARKSLQVGKNGPPIRAYLMEVPQEFYDEDQAEKEEAIRSVEDQIRNASVGDGIGRSEDGKSVVYDPSHGNNQLLE